MANRNQDIDAITVYIIGRKPLISQYPALEKVIKDYEVWLSNQGWYSRTIDGDSTFSNAKYFRDEVNRIIGAEIPKDWVPADAASAAETTAKKPTKWETLSATNQFAIVGAAVGVTALLVLSGPLYFNVWLKSKAVPRLNPKP